MRTASAGSVYIRSPGGLYLTADYSGITVMVMMAPKCRASAWKLVDRGSSGQENDVARVALQHRVTRWYLQAKPRWLIKQEHWVRCVEKEGSATTFAVRPIATGSAELASTM